MPGRPNLEQPRELLEWANETADDPRRTRLDLLQVANYLALQARQNAELRSSVSQVSEFLAGQSVPAEDLTIFGREVVDVCVKFSGGAGQAGPGGVVIDVTGDGG
jgi:hypothetical protein